MMDCSRSSEASVYDIVSTRKLFGNIEPFDRTAFLASWIETWYSRHVLTAIRTKYKLDSMYQGAMASV